jgi:hypothetical protein
VPIGVADAREFVIANAGTQPLSLSSIAVHGAAFVVDATGGDNPCGDGSASIAADNSCTIQVSFTPTGPEDYAATLSVTSNDPSQATLTLALSGAGSAADNGGSGTDGGCGCSNRAGESGSALELALAATTLLLFRRRRARL